MCMWLYELSLCFKQRTSYEIRISDWSSDVCSSELGPAVDREARRTFAAADQVATVGAGPPSLGLNLPGPHAIPMAMLTAVIERPPQAPPAHAAASVDAATDERALVTAAARGEMAAFEALYRRHAGRIHGVIARLVGRDRKSTRLNSSH